jgi:hypothetical protein
MTQAVEFVSCAMIYISYLIKFCFLKHLSNIGFASAVLKAVILVLVMGGIYEVRR